MTNTTVDRRVCTWKRVIQTLPLSHLSLQRSDLFFLSHSIRSNWWIDGFICRLIDGYDFSDFLMWVINRFLILFPYTNFELAKIRKQKLTQLKLAKNLTYTKIILIRYWFNINWIIFDRIRCYWLIYANLITDKKSQTPYYCGD